MMTETAIAARLARCLAILLLPVAALAPAHARNASSLVDDGQCAAGRATGLRWGLCNDPALRQMVVAIEQKHRQLVRGLDRKTGKALIDNWNWLIMQLDKQIGSRWLDIASEDVDVLLRERSDFLDRIDADPPAGPVGTWENSMGRVTVNKHDDGIFVTFIIAIEDFAGGCWLPATGLPTMMNGEAVAVNGAGVRRRGDSLKLTLDRGTYGPEDPCAMMGGIYFPVRPSGSGSMIAVERQKPGS